MCRDFEVNIKTTKEAEMKKVTISVCEKGTRYGEPGKLIKTIQRRAWLEAIGNFNPMFCRYNKERHLVQSIEGDLSDPFRRTESYLTTLYIEVV
jgi:hypothetical protein